MYNLALQLIHPVSNSISHRMLNMKLNLKPTIKSNLKSALSCVLLMFVFVLPSANAHTNSDDFCHVNLEATVKIDSASIEFFDENERSLYKIINDQTLIVQGQTLVLNEDQQTLVTQYSKQIKAVIPEVKSLVVASIALAKDGIVIAFDTLLGENNNISKDIVSEMAQLEDHILAKLSTEQPLVINNDGIKGDKWFSQEFEQKMESVIEKTVENSIGSMLVLLGQSMISSGGMSGFEEKMERFSEQIEQEMEVRSAKIEQQGEHLCLSLVKIEQLEEKMQNSIKELKDVNIIELNKNRNQHTDS